MQKEITNNRREIDQLRTEFEVMLKDTSAVLKVETIMQTVTLNEAQNHLVDLVEVAVAGEVVSIKKNDDVTLQLVPHVAKRRKRQFGSAKGLISMAPNFDAPLD